MILNRHYAEAGQIGDSFGIFNGLSLIIVSITLIIQVNESRRSRIEQELINTNTKQLFYTQLDYNYNLEVHKNNRNSLNNIYDLYHKYFHQFIEANTLEINVSDYNGISSTTIISLSRRILDYPLCKLIDHVNTVFALSIEYIKFPDENDYEDTFSYGLAVFTNIEFKIKEIEDLITNDFDTFLKGLKK